MEEEKPPRKWAGRNTGKPVTQTAISVKLDNDLLEYLKAYKGEKRNTFINNSVRERVNWLEELIEEGKRLSEP